MSIALIISVGLLLQNPTSSSDEELRNHLARLNRTVESNSNSLPKRVSVLLEMTAALDRAAQGATDHAQAQAYWKEAISRIDDFVARNDDREQEPILPLRLQAAVYVWEQGRSWLDRAADHPGDNESLENAKTRLELADERLRKVISDAKEHQLVWENARFRLAQSLSDLASLKPTKPDDRTRLIDEGIKQLEAPFEEPALSGYAGLLRADLLRRNGRLDEAMKAIEAIESKQPMPPEADLLNVVVSVLTAKNQFEQSLKRIETSALPEVEKAIQRVRVRLAQHARLGPGAERTRIEIQAIKVAEPLRGNTGRVPRQTLTDLATAIDMPGIESDPADFELIAEGHVLAGRAVRAAELLVRAADRAKTLGKEDGSSQDRLRAGAILFRDGKFAETEKALKPVVEDPKAGTARPRASLLRILAADRGSMLQPPTIPRADYLKALKTHLDAFPEDQSSSEIRWLLGTEYRRLGKKDESTKLWNAIAKSSPRWIDSRLVIADELEDELARLLPSGDSATLTEKSKQARDFLQASRSQAGQDEALAELTLRLCRLDLMPIVGRPESARDTLEEFLKHPATAAQLNLARLYLVVALAESGRVVDAESRARIEARVARPDDVMTAVRLLDRAASETESDLSRIRAASILKILLTPMLLRTENVPEALRPELKLRQARTYALGGEAANARSVVASMTINPEAVSDALLRDLADLYLRIDAHALVIDVERLRSRRFAPGSPSWFEARYGLALAYFRAKKPADAREIIDATAILHPSLGGGSLKEKFEKLRRKVGESN